MLHEITIGTNNVGTTDANPDEEGVEALKKAVKNANVEKRPGSSKVTASSKQHQVAMAECGEGLYNVVSTTNGSDRRTAKNLKLEDVEEFVKKHAEETKTSYVDKAREKSINGGKEIKKEEEKEEVAGGNKEPDTDEMEDSKEDTQKDIADDTTTKADEKPNKELVPVDDETAAPLGGELVNKIEKIIDRVLKAKNKAEPKAEYRKNRHDKRESRQLSVKVKDTPAIKGTEKPIGKPSPKKNN